MLRVLRYFPLKLSDFQSVVTLEASKKRITYLDKDTEIGYIEYKPCTGKICLFFITDERYRNRGLGKQILDHVLDDFRKQQIKRVWLVTNKCPHAFWEQNGFSYTECPDSSVTMHGYTRTL